MSEDHAPAAPLVVIVQCTAQKRDGRHPARNLYDESDYFVKQRAYAEAVGDRWFIQSAEHGLLEPDERVDSYDTRPEDLDDPDHWGEAIANHLASVVDSSAVVRVLGGAAYADPLTPALEARGYEVIEPLRGQRIGERKQTLKAAAGGVS